MYAHSSMRNAGVKSVKFMKGDIQITDCDPWGWFDVRPQGQMVVSFESRRYPGYFLEVTNQSENSNYADVRLFQR